MIEIAILIQSIFFIEQNKHEYILFFILLSCILMYFSKNQIYFLVIPMIITHLLYLYLSSFDTSIDPFKARIRVRARKPSIRVKKGKLIIKKPKLKVTVTPPKLKSIKKGIRKGIRKPLRKSRSFGKKLRKRVRKRTKSLRKRTKSLRNGRIVRALKELKRMTGLNTQQRQKINSLNYQLSRLRSQLRNSSNNNNMMGRENKQINNTLRQIYRISSSDT
uniref:Uncharacterized protein n=1 Tax=viral metagenome TaxID=1070528 RepID=A0A6C0CMI1_9ZZZZ